MLNGKDAIQRDFDRLERSVCANFVKFNKTKCKVLQSVRAISSTNSVWVEMGSKAPLRRKTWECWKMRSLTCKCTLATQKAKCIQGYIERRMTSRSDSTPALHFCETPPGVLNTTLGPPRQEVCPHVGVGPGGCH